MLGVPWRRLPMSSNVRPSGSPKRSSHSMCAAWNRNVPPSTVPSVETSAGSPSRSLFDAGAQSIGVGAAAGFPCLVVDHAELVHQDFLRLARRLQRVGVDDAVERRQQKLIREHRELHGEMTQVIQRHVAVREPGGVVVRRHHRVPHEFTFDRLLERLEVLACHEHPPLISTS